MKKKIMALVLATVMALSVTSVAFADNGKKGNSWHNGQKDKGKIEVKYNHNSHKNIQKEIQKIENKIVIINKQVQHWTTLKTEIEKKIATNATQVATGDIVRVELYTRQLADLETWHTAAIAVVGRTADQISEINKVYTTEKTMLMAKLTKAQTVNTDKGEGLQNALAHTNKKIAELNKELTELNKKLIELKAKVTVTPVPTTH